MTIFLMLLLLAHPIPGPADDAKWKEFSSEDGRFSALMPETPKVSDTLTFTPYGQLVTRTASSDDAGLNSYSISWTVYPKEVKKWSDADKALEAAASAFARSKGASIVYDNAIWKGGFRGREMLLEHQGRRTKVLFLCVKDHFFQVMAEFRRDDKSSRNSEKFLGSFRMVDGQPM
jgi:hypothetical protein